jgi:hypothetical protein
MAALSQSFGHPKTNFLLASHKIISNQPSVRDFFENLFCPLTMIQMNTICPPPLPCRSPHHTHAKLHPDSPAPEHPRKYGNTGISVFFLVYTQTTYEFMNRSEVPRRNTEIPVFPYFRYFRRSPPKKTSIQGLILPSKSARQTSKRFEVYTGIPKPRRLGSGGSVYRTLLIYGLP